MPLVPVIVFTYKRAGFTRQVLESLSKNYLAKETEVYVFANMYNDETDRAGVEETRSVLENYRKYFASYNIVYRERHLDVKSNMKDGIREVFEKHDKVICLEDDIVTAANFLNYMNQALAHYENDENVFSVCAYNCVQIGDMLREDTFLHKIFRSWGYGLWRDKYDKVNFNSVFEYVYTLNPQKIFRISPTLYHLLVLCQIGLITQVYLDAELMLYQAVKNMRMVFPKESYCDCIDDGSGLSAMNSKRKNNIINHNFTPDCTRTKFMFSDYYLEDIVSSKVYTEFIIKVFEWGYIKKDNNAAGTLSYSLRMALSWMYLQDIPLDYYFKKHKFKKIAIYACGAYGIRFYNLISKSDYVQVAYAMDKDKNKTLGNLKMSQSIIPGEPIDAVVVTYIPDYLEIRDALQCEQPVLDFLSIVMESLLDFGVPQKMRRFMLGMLNQEQER